jgi:hypothetical protein
MSRVVMLMMAGSLLTAPAVQAAGQDPLDVRVTIDYRNAAAADVIGALARAAGLPLEVGAGILLPVTITLTNVRLGTALNAVCENASCAWRLQGTLKVAPIGNDGSAVLPPRVSFDLHDTPASDVFRALAAAINVPLSLDLDLSGGPISIEIKNAATADVLNMLCNLQHCDWSFDAARGLRVTRKR